MERTVHSKMLRRDNVFTDNPFLVKTVVVECIFTVAFLVVIGLCVRVLLRGRGSRTVYGLVLASSIFYVVDLVLDIVENTVILTVENATAILHLFQTEAFFGAMAFPILFAGVMLAVLKRYEFIFGVAGRRVHAFDPLVVLGAAIVAWQVIVSLVLAGFEINIYNFEFNRILDGSVFIQFVKKINRINTTGYARSASICFGCLYIVFTIVYTYMKMNKNHNFHDNVTKWMALLVMPTVALNFLYVLIFTVLLSPNVSNEVFTTDASANAIDLADSIVSPGVPFLIALALVGIGLKEKIWKHATTSTEGFVPMNDWPAAPPSYRSAEPGTGSEVKDFESVISV